MTDSTSRTPDKLLSVSRNDSGRAELEGIRARRRQGHQSENNQAIGGRVSQDEDVGGDDSSSSDSDAERRRRRRIRRRLKHKHNEDPIPLRLPWTKWMNSEAKNHTVAVIGEFVGTALFLFFAFAGTGVANIPQGNSATGTTTGAATGFNLTTLLYISISFGFSLMVNAWVFFRISGGLFNPAVTLALALLGALTPVRAVLLFIAQLSGACFASILVKSIFPTAFNVQTTLASGTSLARGVFIEAFCTAELVFTIIMLAKEKHRATFIAPIGIGLALFIGELVGVYYTGGSLNPARSFGPAAVSHNFESTHWIYWLGPFVGTIMAVAFYKLIKILEYEMANPGQDGDVENDPTQNPDHEIAQVVEERAVEVEEIQAIEEQGGFDALTDGTPGRSGAATPVAGRGIVESSTNEYLQNQRASRFSEDLEAQWSGGEKAASVGKSGKGTYAS